MTPMLLHIAEKHFNPIIVLFLTFRISQLRTTTTDFNPIIVLFLTHQKGDWSLRLWSISILL